MVETLKQWLRESSNIVFFGGAGVSTESGLKDFRSVDGLYHEKFDYPPETILSHSFFMAQPEEFYKFYREKMLAPSVLPNVVHETLARWEREGRLRAVITQNIDGLHQAAGSEKVYELHGSVHRNHCMKCGAFYGVDAIAESSGVPRCACGGMLKPDVVLYEEGLDDECVTGALNAMENADVLLVCGTSLTVYPAAGFLRYYRGNKLVLINRDETPYDHRADLVLHESLGAIFRQL